MRPLCPCTHTFTGFDRHMSSAAKNESVSMPALLTFSVHHSAIFPFAERHSHAKMTRRAAGAVRTMDILSICATLNVWAAFAHTSESQRRARAHVMRSCVHLLWLGTVILPFGMQLIANYIGIAAIHGSMHICLWILWCCIGMHVRFIFIHCTLWVLANNMV